MFNDVWQFVAHRRADACAFDNTDGCAGIGRAHGDRIMFDQPIATLTDAEGEALRRLERDAGNGSADTASHGVWAALAFLVDCAYTSAGIINGEIRPKAGKLRLIERAGASEMYRKQDEPVHAFASNLSRAAHGTAITAAHTALTQTFGPLTDSHLSTLSQLDELRWFVYLLRCCYVHYPLRPRWDIKSQRLHRRFYFADLGIDVDTSTLDGQPFDPLLIGGTGGLLRLIDHCRKIIEAEAAKGARKRVAFVD
jgi:hypothetical protein